MLIFSVTIGLIYSPVITFCYFILGKIVRTGSILSNLDLSLYCFTNIRFYQNIKQILIILRNEKPPYKYIKWYKNGDRIPYHIPEKTRSFDFLVIGNRLNHKVRAVADIGHSAEEYCRY